MNGMGNAIVAMFWMTVIAASVGGVIVWEIISWLIAHVSINWN